MTGKILNHGKRRKKMALAIGFGLLFVMCSPKDVVAGSTKFTASLQQQGVWNSNPLLRLGEVEAIYGSTTSPAFSLRGETETSRYEAKLQLDQNFFNDDSYNSTDVNASVLYDKEFRRVSAGMRASVDYDTTRTGELTDLGLSTKLVRRTAFNAAPHVGYKLSPVSKVDFAGGYSKVAYDQETHTDYHTFSFSPTYNRNFTELWAGSLSVRARRYETDEGVDRRVDSIGPMLGLSTKIMPKWSAKISAGSEASREEEEGEVVRDWKWNMTYAADLAFKGDQDTLTLTSSRSQQSYANGQDKLLTTVALRNAHAFNKSLTVNLGASYQFADTNETEVSQLDRKYTGDAALVYHATREVDLMTSYRYVNEALTGNDKIARQNIARIALTYRPELEGTSW